MPTPKNSLARKSLLEKLFWNEALRLHIPEALVTLMAQGFALLNVVKVIESQQNPKELHTRKNVMLYKFQLAICKTPIMCL